MPPPYHIRPFRMSDMHAVLAIERASFGADAYDRNWFAEILHKCGRLFLVAETAGGVRAYIVTAIRGPAGRAELVSVAVYPPYRGRGVAASLIESTLRRLRLRHVRELTLAVRASNQPAQALYAKFGFGQPRRIRCYYENGEDALALRKLL